jgi:medium-chain acyl-[acyl-carrier-protein] hydrolase
VPIATTNANWIIRHKSKVKARFRIFCFPYAGAGASVFNDWDSIVPVGVEICSIQLPGRETRQRETPVTRIFPLIDALCEVLEPYLELPYSIYGHSMGALLGFETARQCRRQERRLPVSLLLSGCRAPQLRDPHRPMHQLSEPEFIAKLRKMDGTPEVVLRNRELVDLLLPVLRADFAVCETYKYLPEPPLPCAIAAIGGTEDPRATRDELAAWREQTSGSFDLRMLPGNHFFFRNAGTLFLRFVSQRLQEDLRRASAI